MTAKLPSSSDLLQSALCEQYGILSRDVEHPEVLAGFLYSKKVISKEDKKRATVPGLLSKNERTCAVLNAVEDCLSDSSNPLKVMEDFCTALENCKELALKESVAYLRAQIAMAQKHEMEYMYVSLAGDKDASPTRKKADMMTIETAYSWDKSDIAVVDKETMEFHVGNEKKEESSNEREEPQKSTDAAPKHELEHSSSTDDGTGSLVSKNADTIKAESVCLHQIKIIPKEKETVKSQVSSYEKEESSDESEEPQKFADTGHKAMVQKCELECSFSVDGESVSHVRKTPDSRCLLIHAVKNSL